MKIMISACLTGENCKYNGGNNRNEKILRLMKGNEVITVCYTKEQVDEVLSFAEITPAVIWEDWNAASTAVPLTFSLNSPTR